MKNVIVLGANGQLGLTFREFESKEGFNFTFYSRKEVDITDSKSLDRVFYKSSFHYCINCAAYTNVDLAEKEQEEAFKVNAIGPKNIAEICNELDIILIQISTDYVFDGTSSAPYKEDNVTEPLNIYGRSKRDGEHNIVCNTKKYYIVRTSWLYSKYLSNFLKTVIRKIKNNETLYITNSEIGTPTQSSDLAEFILYLIEDGQVEYGVYHFSARGSTSWYGFARHIVNLYDSKKISKIKPVDHFDTIATRPKYSVLDLEKTEAVYKELSTWEESSQKLLSRYDFS
ncbi:dTDP-4-dehydrorhamnose reductase [Winogradskyella poriferorum]|uniref:dTDP-4-dehydrorhamnose reductase n=1 Tax=Winogradskyella poriferorum TaxID=307627 RepID=UPI003D650B72